MSFLFTRTMLASSGYDPGEDSFTTLRLLSPRAIGSPGVGVGTGLETNDRVFRICPNKEYDIPVRCVGGRLAYSCALSGAPAGMVVEQYDPPNSAFLSSRSRPWRIRWPTPTGTPGAITLIVTDANASFVIGIYTPVVSASGFQYVDFAASGGGDGTEGDPWNGLDELHAGSAANAITYFKTGTYTLTENLDGGDYFHTMEFNSANQSAIWLAYPGHTPRLTQSYAGTPAVDFVSLELNQSDGTTPPWIQGFVFEDSMEKGVLIGNYDGYGWCIYNCTFEDFGPAVNGANSGAISQRDNFAFGASGFGSSVVSCLFRRMGRWDDPTVHEGGNIGLKGYSLSDLLVEGCLVEDVGEHTEGFFAIKGECPAFTIRLNTALTNLNAPLWGGNMASSTDVVFCYGEACYNNASGGGDCISAGSHDTLSTPQGVGDEEAQTVYEYRNTYQGRIWLIGVTAANGIYTNKRNVIINVDGAQSPWPFFYEFDVDAARIAVGTNLTNVSAAVYINTSTGRLLDSQYEGHYGHWIP